jgi:hypothetical protein
MPALKADEALSANAKRLLSKCFMAFLSRDIGPVGSCAIELAVHALG